MVFRASHADRATPWCISSRQNHIHPVKFVRSAKDNARARYGTMLLASAQSCCSTNACLYTCHHNYLYNVTCLHLPWLTYSPELMKDAIMPLNLTRASCSSSALVVSDSLGSADLGIPMETASCRSWPVT